MKERELTGNTGEISKQLVNPWTWERIPDLPQKQRTGIGYDGLLCNPPFLAIRTEVKIGNRKLKPSEENKAKKCKDSGEWYFILRYWTTYWTLENLTTTEKYEGELNSILRQITQKINWVVLEAKRHGKRKRNL